MPSTHTNTDAIHETSGSQGLEKFNILALVHENHEVPHLHAWTDLCSQPVPAGERTGALQDQSLYSHEA